MRLFELPICRWLMIGLLAYLASSFLVLIGINFGQEFVTVDGVPQPQMRPSLLSPSSASVGKYYEEIVEHGYTYNQKERSTVAFFPGYPLLAKFVVVLTGWSSTLGLLVVSNVMLFAAFAATTAYLQARWPEAASGERCLVLALIGVFPATFFFRMTYSESTFLFGLTFLLNGMARHWPVLFLAIVAGAVTACRPVGVACTAAFLWYVLSDPARGTIFRRVRLSVICLPLACWGLLAYMGYQEAAFGNPVAFAQTQEHWSSRSFRHPEFWDKTESLLTAEPIFSVYDCDSLRWWARNNTGINPLFSLYFWNPILFVGALILVGFGRSRHWLTGSETILGVGLLAIPYVTWSYEMSMVSHARFGSTVVPAYLVAARLMRPLPQWAIWTVFATFAVILTVWSALFAAGHDFS